MVMEYAQLGDVNQKISSLVNNNQSMPEDKVW